MGAIGRLKAAYTAFKGSSDLAGVEAPWPRLSYPQFPVGFETLTNLLANTRRSLNPADANEGRDNAIVQIALGWMATSMPSAVAQVGIMDGDNFVPDESRHPYLDILARPNANYTGKWLMSSLNDNWWRRGNGYIHLVKTRRGKLMGMDWLPAKYCRPIPNGQGHLDYYEYSPLGGRFQIDPDDILHFRFGIDEDNPLQGLAPLGAVYREIITDNGYSDYAAGLGMWGGVPELMFSPRVTVNKDGIPVGGMSQEQARAMTRDLAEKIKKNKGEPRFVGGAVEMHKMGIEPDKMALTEVRREPETRIPAVFGIPPIVLGLAAGLDKATYSNYETAVKYAWQNCLIPTLDYFAAELTVALQRCYPDAASAGKIVKFSTNNVPELQSDINALRESARQDFDAGIILLEEARAEGGYSTDSSIIEQLKDETLAKVATGVLQPLAQDGSGQTTPGEQQEGEVVKIAGKSWFIPRGIIDAIKKKTDDSDGLMTIFDAVKRYRDLLDGHEENALAALRKVLDIAKESIEAKAAALDTEIEEAQTHGYVINEGWILSSQRYADLINAIEAGYATIASQSVTGAISEAQSGAIEDSIRSSEAMARASIGQQPEAATTAGVTVNWNTVNVDQIANVIGRCSDGSPLADVLSAVGPDAVSKVQSALASGIAEGSGPRAVARVISAQIGVSSARAETIARTEMLQAARLATRQSYLANADVVDGWIWLAACDLRTCAACWAMQGSEHSNEETLDSHPNCRCVMAPRTKSWADLLGEDGADLPDNRPVIETGEALFGKLSKEKQAQILGPGLYALFEKGDISLGDCVHETTDARWGAGRQPATIAQVTAAKKAGKE